MLCPPRLKAVNYCEMNELRRMDAWKLEEMQMEQDLLSTKMLIPIHVISMICTLVFMSIISATIYDNVSKIIFFRFRVIPDIFKNGSIKRISLSLVGIAVAQSIFLLVWKFIYKEINLDKGSWYFHNRRITRLRSNIIYIENLTLFRPCDIKYKELDRLKTHFQSILRKYR